MIKNQKFKMFMSNTIFRVLSLFNMALPKDDNVVMFYNNMGFRDNVEYLYNYMIENGYNKKYKIIRSQNEKFEGNVPEHVKIVSNAMAVFWYLRAGHVFYCHGKLPIFPSKKQCVIQMWHGTPFKAPDDWQLKTVPKRPYYTKIFISSDYFREIVKKAHGLGDENIAICGQPRTDMMFVGGEKYRELTSFRKVIIWMPTFRKSSVLGYSNTGKEEFLIPLFEKDCYEELNAKLKSQNICMIVKLHAMQDAGDFSTNYSHLWLLTDREFSEKKWNLYKLLGQCDALITDYSSVFYDFMLLNRPIAFTVDDLEDYKEHRGFAVEDPDYLMAGYKVKTKEDIYEFIRDVADGVDCYSDIRHEVNALVNRYNDGQQCKRALEISGIHL